jgi:hypothetical protein
VILYPTEAPDFFALLASLDTFANQRLRIVPGLDDVREMQQAGLQHRYEIRSRAWADPEILEAFVRTNPHGLAAPLIDDARQLRHRVAGRFFCERVLKKHAIFVAMTEPVAVYAVEGLTDPIDAVLSRSQRVGVAVMLDAVLIPWRGRIVWDGLVHVLPIHSGPGIRRSFKAEYTRAKDRGQIVTSLGNAPAAVAKPRRPRVDWGPAVSGIVRAADALGRPGTTLEGPRSRSSARARAWPRRRSRRTATRCWRPRARSTGPTAR